MCSLEVMRPLQMALQEPSLDALAPPDNVLPRTRQHLISKQPLSLLQPTAAGGNGLAAVGKVAGNGLALILEALLADVALGVDVVGALHPLQRQAAVHVPHDVAVHQPRARVVGLEANDGVSGRVAGTAGADEHGSVAADRVVEVQGGD